LRKLKFDHFYFLAQSLFAKHFRAEVSALVAAAKIARTNLPNQITTLHMVVRYTTLPRIMIKLAPCRSLVQRHDGVRTHRTIAHSRYIQPGSTVRLPALRTSD